MEKDAWHLLTQYTNARIAMGRAGTSLPTHEVLQLRMAHSQAKDAINSEIDVNSLTEIFKAQGLDTLFVQSQVTDRNDYLRNPNKGRLLNYASERLLQSSKTDKRDLCIIVADGLSATAVNIHAEKIIELLLPQLPDWTLTPIVIAQYSRVALSDAIGELLNARIALILIGERPGLSSPHSMGAYLTYQPQAGNTDERRNCISNIQPQGLVYEAATASIAYLLKAMLVKQISGVQLKDDRTDIYLT